MRRPVSCGGSDVSPAESALSRVRRMLSSSLPGRRTASKTMGVSLEELTARPDAQDGVPFIVLRLCSYIDSTGISSVELCQPPTHDKQFESLKCTFDRTGDADLENSATPSAATALLKFFLQQLPEPPVTDSVANDLLNLIEENSTDCSKEIKKILSTMPEANRRLIRHISYFLRRVARRDAKKKADIEVIGSSFGPFLFKYDGNPGRQKIFNAVTTQMVLDFHLIFPECSDDGLAGMHGEPPLEVSLEMPAELSVAHHRKRKERHESTGSSQIPQERKVIRSNSQERPTEDVNEKDKIASQKSSVMIEDMEETGNTNKNLMPLHEHNSPSTAPMEEEDNEHERRRSSERFASYPRSSTPRGGNRRHHQPRKTRRGNSYDSKENERVHHHHHHHHHHLQPREDESVPNTSHSFLQLHPQDECESRERSPSPATPKAAPPALDLSTLHQQIGYTEPVPSQPPHHRVPEDTQVLLSPRNSVILTRRMDPNVAPSPPVEHSEPLRRRDEESYETKTKQINKQIANLKKKIKVYEEQFESENGYRPSHADKLNNKDLKKMFSELTKLRKELKQVKEDAANKTVQQSNDKKLPTIVIPTLGDTLKEVQNRLEEKRTESGRPVDLESLSREQLLSEKVALQKALLHLESLHGRPSTKGDRDLVRPLYDRYRSLKRLVIRSGGSKLRDSMSELATILEHETMDFTSPPETGQNMLPSSDFDAVENEGQDEEEEQCENLHSLSLTELIARQAEAKELKHKLRRELRDFEDEFQRATGRRLQKEDREPKQKEYAVYKQAKARLRLLEALLNKRGGSQFTRSC
ncbi:Hypothetical predicted protein [Cloeon dipterum]|uniref:Rho-GAP domain-containing protein n=2 Tax=Cloeon dipterum TaxID=197152 RepID=A0A8S1C8G2_9INSE|nr:Hypothetical predicted protein [Cloeon dipterum]